MKPNLKHERAQLDAQLLAIDKILKGAKDALGYDPTEHIESDEIKHRRCGQWSGRKWVPAADIKQNGNPIMNLPRKKFPASVEQQLNEQGATYHGHGQVEIQLPQGRALFACDQVAQLCKTIATLYQDLPFDNRALYRAPGPARKAQHVVNFAGGLDAIRWAVRGALDNLREAQRSGDVRVLKAMVEHFQVVYDDTRSSTPAQYRDALATEFNEEVRQAGRDFFKMEGGKLTPKTLAELSACMDPNAAPAPKRKAKPKAHEPAPAEVQHEPRPIVRQETVPDVLERSIRAAGLPADRVVVASVPTPGRWAKLRPSHYLHPDPEPVNEPADHEQVTNRATAAARPLIERLDAGTLDREGINELRRVLGQAHREGFYGTYGTEDARRAMVRAVQKFRRQWIKQQATKAAA